MENTECIIVAGGPSLRNQDWDSLTNRSEDIIAINRAYEKCPTAKYLFWVDLRFWNNHKKGILSHPAPFKVTAERKPIKVQYPPNITRFKFSGLSGYDSRDCYLRTGNNSGYAAICLAEKLGYKTVYLLGYDMKYDDDGNSHFHDGHYYLDGRPIGHREDTLTDKMLPYFTELSEVLPDDIRVINCNPDSAIQCFEFGELP